MYPNCGTYAGYKKHKNKKTFPCPQCLIACAEYSRGRYQVTIDRKRELAKMRNSKPERKAYIKEYKKKNKEHILQMNRAFVEANREKVAAQKKQWKIDNPERNLHANRKAERARRARLKNNITIPYTEPQVLSTYGVNCNICGLEIDLLSTRQVGKPGWQQGLHIDHLIPVSKGGPDTLENVRPTHGICNLKKNNTII
jgi:5-methylcytosine-specific restriction endonuclease McrA